MTDTDLSTATPARRGLTSMLLPELRGLAGELGIKGTSGMRKGDLIEAIRAHQAGGRPAAASAPAPEKAADQAKAPAAQARAERAAAPDREQRDEPKQERSDKQDRPRRDAKNDTAKTDTAKTEAGKNDAGKADLRQGDKQPAEGKSAEGKSSEGKSGEGKAAEGKAAEGKAAEGKSSEGKSGERNQNRNRDGQNRDNQNRQGDKRNQGGQNQGGQNQRGGQNNNQHDDEDGEGGGRRRGRRFRERRRREGGQGGGGGEPQLNEGDVVAPVAGILDVLDNYAFVRTSGYLAGPNDVYVSMNMVRRYGLRRGDAITGAVKVPREGEQQSNQRQKFNPLVRLDTVNGGEPDASRKRPDFNKLTPLYPNQRLRLETTPERLSTRVIDLIMPIGKGQRALIVSPPKAGKTTILQDIANAITTNNPECHLMVVLVDERPEEVTDMQRSVKGEVIASTFDRPPSDHTSVAELAIERAKRLVEQGQDVVVLLDSITRLGRAYNNASPASGRILSGGVDSTALYPPKRFLGAARNIENGGSLTIVATAMVETGSTGDTVIFEEFKGTGNAELKLDRKIAERRVFPAVDVNPSGTRKDELLLSPDEFAIVHKLRRLLSGLDSQQAIDLLINQLKKSRSNVEFLMQVQKTAPGGLDQD
ncbi:transcription termination factor Rho [Gordonia sp. VNK21]|uniref:transcription termination factor Rho n=1 Tax=Gordonia sp. VNK21 TaxID=3382483 RepID=UPI0038D36F5D